MIPLVVVRHEMIDRQQGALRGVGYDHLISNMREWIKLFHKNAPKIYKTEVK